MLNIALLSEGLKSLPVPADISAPLSHCQSLNIKAQRLGFRDYHHFRQVLKKVPEDEFAMSPQHSCKKSAQCACQTRGRSTTISRLSSTA